LVNNGNVVLPYRRKNDRATFGAGRKKMIAHFAHDKICRFELIINNQEMLSYWERESFLHYDHIVIGAGIVGMSTAIELKALYPKASVLVLERGLLPAGASTRNAGFACMGSATELLDDMESMSTEEVVSLFALRKRGLDLLRQRLGDARIDYHANGSYELISEQEMGALEKLDMLNQLLLPITGKPAYVSAHHKISEFGFAGAYAHGLIENTCEGELNSGKMMRALTDTAISVGVEIKTGASVTRYEEGQHHVTVTVHDAFRKEQWRMHCTTLSICTNAFTKHLLPDEDVVPGRGQVMITKPITGIKFKGVYHFDKGYYYFREIDGRVLFGGGRNLDFDTERTTEIDLNQQIQQDLVQKLSAIILPDIPFEIDMQWSGIMAFGASKYPVVKAISKRVFGAFRMGGMGVAMGSAVAFDLAQIISQNT
jgi:glycine/D-amino acid oxidase-like deaminating enzyme